MPEVQGIQSTTQQFLDIYDVTNDMVVLKDGSTSIVLTVNAMNFGLLAEAEQDAVIYSYAALLNSLNYPIQIVIRSQTKDASSYLQLLQEQEDQAAERTKREWIHRYKEFVANLIHERNVLDKKFYVVIPASSLEMGLTLGQNLVSGFKTQSIEGVEKSVILEKARALLEPKRDHLIAQFNRIGLYARQLKTQEIIQLFYTSYNPEAAEGQQITDSRSYTTPLVEAQIRGVTMTNTTTDSTTAATVNPTTATPNVGDTTTATTPTPPAELGSVELGSATQSSQPTPANIGGSTASAPTTPTTTTPNQTPAGAQTPPAMAANLAAPTPASTSSTPTTSPSPSPLTPNPTPMATSASGPLTTPTNPTTPITSPTPSVTTTPTPPTPPAELGSVELGSATQSSQPTPAAPTATSPMPSSPTSITESPMVTTPSTAQPTPNQVSGLTPTPKATEPEAEIQNELNTALKELGSAGTNADKKTNSTNPSPTMPAPTPPVSAGGSSPTNSTPSTTLIDDELPPLPEI